MFSPFKPRLPSILKSLDKAQSDLNRFADLSKAKAQRAADALSYHSENAGRAETVAKNLAKLTS